MLSPRQATDGAWVLGGDRHWCLSTPGSRETWWVWGRLSQRRRNPVLKLQGLKLFTKTFYKKFAHGPPKELVRQGGRNVDPVPVSQRKTPRKKGVPWDRDTGTPKEGSATVLRAEAGWGHWPGGGSVVKEGTLPAIWGSMGQVAPRDLRGVPAVVTFGARAQSLDP